MTSKWIPKNEKSQLFNLIWAGKLNSLITFVSGSQPGCRGTLEHPKYLCMTSISKFAVYLVDGCQLFTS
jgi:hypothetical protein